jgi:hypothetical protein
MGAVGQKPAGLGRREHGSPFFDRTAESRDEDGVVGEGTSWSWGVNVVIGAVTVVGG